ncbi:uncharacterized protein PAC_09280 [Phialocephala subalpina]|uniref:NAD dependent epimerase/dehydratase n=1 Tax=Phialocephala subalpina TaxID=576137 RepID=A0A1L7X318_9HELO|nr:uncharacterized protein PAC_09280 [Phialocephala subalpina]
MPTLVGGRYVDRIPVRDPRPVEMQVLCLGLSRTGTMSLYTALGKLGYKSYHFMEIFSPEGISFKAIWCWKEALRAKLYSEGKPFGKEEFDRVLGSYSAVTDVPNAVFADELIAAYPNAKVVLGVRDPDKWMASVENSFFKVLGWPSYRFITTWIDPVLRAERDVLELVLAQWTDGDIYNRAKVREGFLRHNQHVRDIVPKDNLLEFEAKDGWEPLCAFLGRPVPDEPYPRINEGEYTADLHANLMVIRVATIVGKFMIVPAIAFGIAWGMKTFIATRK